MKILSINTGSSSLKFSLFDMDTDDVLISGLFERIGVDGSCYTLKNSNFKIKEETELKDHSDAIKILLDKLIELDIIRSYDEIDGIGHRIAQGADHYDKSVVITDEVLEDIIKLSDLAPLHNPAHAIGIKAFKKLLPNTPMVAVFDTAFHQTISKDKYLYAVPYEWYEKYGVRKYGFHGTSHDYINKTISSVLNRNDLKVISCHLGQGASVAAIDSGKCVNTSMGLTPLAGVVMGTRSGDIDVSIVPYIMEKEGLSAGEVMTALNKKSGFLGVSGVSSDSRDIEAGIAAGNERCEIAEEMFVNSVVKYIAEYYVEMGGCDVIVFTAGIGENGPDTRARIAEKLAVLGVKIDKEANDVKGKLTCISKDDSKIKLYLVPTNEELMIAKDTLALIK